MDFPAGMKFTKDDEWIMVEDDIATVGISDFAQDQLSDVVYVEVVVSEGETVNKGDTCAVVESVKAAADVYMPISGEILGVNEALADTPEIINTDPYGEAWMVKVKISDPGELDDLMDSTTYEKKVQEQE